MLKNRPFRTIHKLSYGHHNADGGAAIRFNVHINLNRVILVVHTLGVDIKYMISK